MKPKLLILSSLYPNPDNTLRGIFVQSQAEELAKNFIVRIIAWDFPGKSHKRWREKGIKVDNICFPTLKCFFPSAILTYKFFVLPFIKRVYKHWQPDLIHVHDFAHLPGVYILKGWLNGIQTPKFLTMHNLKSLPGLLNHPCTDIIYSKTLDRALSGWDCIFAVNNVQATFMRKYGSFVEFIGNGIRDIQREDSPDLHEIRAWLGLDSVKIVSVGNLIDTKGFDLLILSTHQLKAEGFKVKTLIAGEGPKSNDLHNMIDVLDLHEEVWLHNPMPHRDIRNLYFDFDIFALPSYSETFGIVFLEAAFASLPLVGVKGQGIWGLFEEGSEALFIEPKDLSDLTAKLRYLSCNDQVRKRLGAQAASKLKKNFMLENILDKIVCRYKDSLS
jgi:teichuronic acid biosynthesis glycosyltransferase TuaC